MQQPEARLSTTVWGDPLWTCRPMLMGRPDGRADLIATTKDIHCVAAWALQFGPDIQVVSPPALRQAIQKTLIDLWTVYTDVPLDSG